MTLQKALTMSKSFPIYYIQTTYGEVIIGQFDKNTNTVHNAITMMSQQTPQGIQVGLVPTGTPMIADPSRKEFHDIELSPNAIGYKINLEESKVAATSQLVKAYRGSISSIMQPTSIQGFQL